MCSIGGCRQSFVPLHNHSDYSLLDGATQLPAMVQRAVDLGMPAVALTDHGVMYGAIELLKLCFKGRHQADHWQRDVFRQRQHR